MTATDIATEAAAAARKIVLRAGENTEWLIGAEWTINQAGTRAHITRPSGIRWVYLGPGSGEFRINMPCRHCGHRFGVSGVKDATSYLRRAAALRQHGGTCTECAPKLVECQDCYARHLPDPGLGGRCAQCHTKAAREIAAAAERLANTKAPAKRWRVGGPCRVCGRRLTDFDLVASAVEGMHFDCA